MDFGSHQARQARERGRGSDPLGIDPGRVDVIPAAVEMGQRRQIVQSRDKA